MYVFINFDSFPTVPPGFCVYFSHRQNDKNRVRRSPGHNAHVSLSALLFYRAAHKNSNAFTVGNFTHKKTVCRKQRFPAHSFYSFVPALRLLGHSP